MAVSMRPVMCVGDLIVLFFWLNATLHSTDFDVQRNCLLRFAFEPSPTSMNVVMLHTRLNQLKHRNPLNGQLVPTMVPGFKVHDLQKDVTMLKLKGLKSKLTCKQIKDTDTYGRLLGW